MEAWRRTLLWYSRKYTSNLDFFTAVHEAGHMTVLEMLDQPAHYAYDVDEDGETPCVVQCGGRLGPFESGLVTVAGDVACLLAMGHEDVGLACQQFHQHFQKKEKKCDWSAMRELGDDLNARICATRVGDLLEDNWGMLVVNYRLAEVFFEMENRLWQASDLLAGHDIVSKFKVFGRGAFDSESLRGRLLDPATTRETIQSIGRVKDNGKKGKK